MKIYLEALGPKSTKEESVLAELQPGNACVRIARAFNAVVFETEDGARYGVALRDSGLEIVCPDEVLVAVKRLDSREGGEGGETFVERDGRFIG